MEAAQFTVDQKVKVKGESDASSGKVLSIAWNSEAGYTYKVSSRYFDAEKNDMVEGSITCREDELVAVVEHTEQTTEGQQ